MTVSGAVQPPEKTAKDEFFGHPSGLTFLFTTEMWERFSYYGMRALLIFYLTKHLLLPGTVETVVGYDAIKGTFEYLSGFFSLIGVFFSNMFGGNQPLTLVTTPIDVQPLSSMIYGTYTGLVYLTPLFGGMLADRVLGQHRTVLIGAALMALGHFMMAFESLFFFALLLLILGNGCFKPNMSAQVGGLYAPGDHRRDRAYSIFYVGINLGAFFSPLVCGTLGETFGWHYGFTAAGIGMTIALVIYSFGLRHLPPDELQISKATHTEHKPLDRQEWKAVLALMVLFLPVTLFWATYEQQGNTMALWIDDHTDRVIDLAFWHGEIPATWFQSFNPFMIFAFTPLVVMLWARQARRGTEPLTVTKMALGCFGCALSYVIMAAAAWQAAGNSASWLWLFAYFVVITFGELYISPIGLSLVSKIAPARIVSMMMGMWLGTSFIGNFLAGYLGSFWSTMNKVHYFLMLAAIAAVAGVIIYSLRWPLRSVLKD